MYRRFAWVVLLAVGALWDSCSVLIRRPSPVLPLPPSRPMNRWTRPSELKEINRHLKEINTLLHTGTIKVVVAIYPDKT